MIKSLFAVPGYRHWLAGRAVSWFGDTVMLLSLSMWVKALTGSSSRAGLTLAFFMAPNLLAPLVGFLVDRWPRRTMLVVGNVVSALALVPLLAVHDAQDVWIVWAVTLVYGVSGVILPAASIAMQRSIVPDDLLADAQGLQQTIGTSFQLVAPVAGASLFAWKGGVGPAAVGFACFVASAALFLAFRNPPAQQRTQERSLAAEMAAGLHHVRRTPDLFDSVVSLVIVESVGGLLEGAMYSVTDTFHRSPEWASSIVVAQGLGMVVGALASARLVGRWGELRSMIVGLLGCSLLALLAAGAPTLWVFLALVTVVGLFIPLVFVASGTLQQRLTPSALMGRVSTAVTPLYSLASVASLSLGAMLVAVWSFRRVYPVVAFGCLVAGLYLVLRSRSRAARQHAQQDVTAS